MKFILSANIVRFFKIQTFCFPLRRAVYSKRFSTKQCVTIVFPAVILELDLYNEYLILQYQIFKF